MRSWPSVRLTVRYSTSSSTPVDASYVVTGVEPDRWKQLCEELVTRLDEYSDTLLRNVQTFTQIGDTQGAEIVQSSCVSCLAHLAVLCDLVGHLEPNSKPQMDAICDSSLERLGHLTQEMKFDGYTYFDLLIRVRFLAVRSSRQAN